jgi:lipopolysaccharide/colanic/teichoic acid biosynthesis glycosyltransferase
MFDLIIAAFALLITIPMMTVIAIAIRLEGPGSVIFQQERIGENGRIFRMLKFRTMIPEAEELRFLVEFVDESGNFIHKAENDPRVTQIGHFLRRTSLDELPQIFNIIKGDMSLVGPRPEMPYMMSYYASWQHSRFAVPQGLTGWWQVNGRSNRPMHLHTDDDLYYVQNYSLLLDVEILLKTVWAVLRGKGAF